MDCRFATWLASQLTAWVKLVLVLSIMSAVRTSNVPVLVVATALAPSCAVRATNRKLKTASCIACSRDTTVSLFLILSQSTTPHAETLPQLLLVRLMRKLWLELGMSLMDSILTTIASPAKNLVSTSIDLVTSLLFSTMHSTTWLQWMVHWYGMTYKCMEAKKLPAF